MIKTINVKTLTQDKDIGSITWKTGKFVNMKINKIIFFQEKHTCTIFVLLYMPKTRLLIWFCYVIY